jgi:hypothetical protein
VLQVRFYLGGEFVRAGNNASDVGGDEDMSYIARDKVFNMNYSWYPDNHERLSLQWLFSSKDIDPV